MMHTEVGMKPTGQISIKKATNIHTYIHTYVHKLYFSLNLRVAIIKANFSTKTITKHTTTKQNKTKQRKTNSILSKYLEQQFPKGKMVEFN